MKLFKYRVKLAEDYIFVRVIGDFCFGVGDFIGRRKAFSNTYIENFIPQDFYS